MMFSKFTSAFGEKFEKIVRFIHGDNKSRDKPFTDSDQEWVLMSPLHPLCCAMLYTGWAKKPDHF